MHVLFATVLPWYLIGDVYGSVRVFRMFHAENAYISEIGGKIAVRRSSCRLAVNTQLQLLLFDLNVQSRSTKFVTSVTAASHTHHTYCTVQYRTFALGRLSSFHGSYNRRLTGRWTDGRTDR